MLNDGGCCSHHLKNCSIQPKAKSSECSQKSHSVRFLENQTIIMYCCRCRPCTAISAIEAVKNKLSERDGMSYSLLFKGWNTLPCLYSGPSLQHDHSSWTRTQLLLLQNFHLLLLSFLMFRVHSSVFNFFNSHVLLNVFLNIAVNLLVKQTNVWFMINYIKEF